MAVNLTGNPANSSTVDTGSANPTATYISQAPINPTIPPVPQPLVRNDLVSLVNSDERGVYIEGKLVPVIGDALSGIGASPNPRPLTSATNYPTIYIGTKT